MTHLVTGQDVFTQKSVRLTVIAQLLHAIIAQIENVKTVALITLSVKNVI